MRTQYETEADLAEEKKAMAEFTNAFSCEAWKNPTPYYQLDYSVGDEDKTLFGMAEVKRRRHKSTDYPTLILSLNKWKAGLDCNALGLTFYVVAAFDDGVFVFTQRAGLDSFSPTIVWGGRTSKTRDAGDIEPVVHLPLASFKRIDGE